jgi:predicted MFS family arabinose efflux permease
VKRLTKMIGMPIWTRELVILALGVFFLRFGEGVVGGARMNFFIDTLSLTDGQVMWLEGMREVPGLALMFIAALMMHLPLSWRGTAAVLLIGVGYALYAVVQSYTALLVVAVVASLGFHLWMPIQPALSMAMVRKDMSGRVLGSLASVGALASIVGMGAIALVSGIMGAWSLRLYYVAGGLIIVIAAVLMLRLPKDIGSSEAKQPRMLIKGRYWLYYVLTFFEGARKQVLASFGALVLVKYYDLKVWQISSLLLVGAVINFLIAPLMGYLLDRFGERRVMPLSYTGLALCCLGFAFVPNVWLLIGFLILIRILSVLNIGLSSYVNRIAPQEELSPTLTAGVSINHVTSVAMPLIIGALLELPQVNYEHIFIGTAVLIGLSVPFTLAMRTKATPALSTQPVPAE